MSTDKSSVGQSPLHCLHVGVCAPHTPPPPVAPHASSHVAQRVLCPCQSMTTRWAGQSMNVEGSILHRSSLFSLFLLLLTGHWSLSGGGSVSGLSPVALAIAIILINKGPFDEVANRWKILRPVPFQVISEWPLLCDFSDYKSPPTGTGTNGHHDVVQSAARDGH